VWEGRKLRGVAKHESAPSAMLKSVLIGIRQL
jgi:hypothetical protein